MHIKALLFDLDNTLYPEIEFVYSGFHEIAKYLSSRYAKDEMAIFQEICKIFEKEGRGKVFNRILSNLGLDNPENIQLLVHMYRTHTPQIYLYKNTLNFLKKFKKLGLKLGIITNGRASVQFRKVQSLKIQSLFDLIIYTDDISDNKEFWKPSSVPFKLALNFFAIPATGALYIGDDPTVDFPGAKECGIKTIQINCQGNYADYSIKSLEDIISLL